MGGFEEVSPESWLAGSDCSSFCFGRTGTGDGVERGAAVIMPDMSGFDVSDSFSMQRCSTFRSHVGFMMLVKGTLERKI
jgi:hypothetical protein